MRIMSYNIRTWMVDEKEFSGELNNWKYRKNALFSLIKRYSPDIFWIQEDSIHQIEDLKSKFWEDYNLFYFDEVMDEDNQEFNSIFIKKTYNVIDKWYFWISETFTKKSKLKDSICVRNANWIKIEINNTQYIVLNVHLDHSEDYDFKFIESKLFINILKDVFWSNINDNFIILWDFNLIPDCNNAHKTISNSFIDVSKILWIREPTHPNWLIRNIYKQIDYFFISENLKDKVKEMRIIKDRYVRLDWIELEPSDHYPILLNIDID